MLSDLYATGVSECDNMLMLLGVSRQMTRQQRDVVTPLIIQGFIGMYRDLWVCTGIGGYVTGICRYEQGFVGMYRDLWVCHRDLWVCTGIIGYVGIMFSIEFSVTVLILYSRASCHWY